MTDTALPPLFVAKRVLPGARSTELIGLMPSMANRHGLVAGATGTGKTVTLRVLAERFSQAGVPVFLADVKGDLAGLGLAGEMNPRVQERLALLERDATLRSPYTASRLDNKCLGRGILCVLKSRQRVG